MLTETANTFGVTLSVLSQGYDISADLNVSVPVDVMFVLDVSASMLKNSGAGANNMVTTVNNAMSALKAMKNGDQNRFGVVLFSEHANDFMPLDNYSLASGTQYISLNRTSDSKATLSTTSGLRNGSGKSFSASFKGDYSSNSSWGGTYTEAGIAYGSMLL